MAGKLLSDCLKIFEHLWHEFDIVALVFDSDHDAIDQNLQRRARDQKYPIGTGGKSFRWKHNIYHRERREVAIVVGVPSRGIGVFYSGRIFRDRKSTRLNSSHLGISYAVI